MWKMNLKSIFQVHKLVKYQTLFSLHKTVAETLETKHHI